MRTIRNTFFITHKRTYVQTCGIKKYRSFSFFFGKQLLKKYPSNFITATIAKLLENIYFKYFFFVELIFTRRLLSLLDLFKNFQFLK